MKKRAPNGFTLIELMIVMTLVAVIIGVGAPKMSQYAKNYRLTSAANDLLVAIYSARSEAIKRQLPTVMCFTTNANPSSGQPDCSGNGTQGWVTWVDTDDDQQVDAGEQILVRHDALNTAISVVTQPASTSKFVAYKPSGFSRSITNALGGVVLCDERKNISIAGYSAARGLTISSTGRPAITRSVSLIATDLSLLAGAASGTTCVP